jgi:hydroxyacylglutathione hydrolase
MQISERIHLVASGANGFGLTHPSDCHVYLIDGGSELALIDAGSGADVQGLRNQLVRTGAVLDRLSRCFITHAHADHAGGAASIREAFGAALTCSPDVARILRNGDEAAASVDVGKAQGTYAADYEYRATAVDDEATDGQRFQVGEVTVETIHTPGHAVGSTCYLLHRDGGSDLFTGDTLLFGGRIILQDTWDCELRSHLDSLRRLANHRFDGFYPGHRSFSLTDGERHLRAALEPLRRGGIPPAFA